MYTITNIKRLSGHWLPI